MYYYNYGRSDMVKSTLKVLAGQAVDQVSPECGLMYHVVATATAKNPLDFALGAVGICLSAGRCKW